jgi:hypothetical protein
MKLLFNPDVIVGNRLKARPGDRLESLPFDQQLAAVTEILDSAENEVHNNEDLQARARQKSASPLPEIFYKN